MERRFEGNLSLLLGKHQSLKDMHTQLSVDFAKEREREAVTQRRLEYMENTLHGMEMRIEKQKEFFDQFQMPMTQDELHAFTGGYKDEQWEVGHRNFGRFS